MASPVRDGRRVNRGEVSSADAQEIASIRQSFARDKDVVKQKLQEFESRRLVEDQMDEQMDGWTMEEAGGQKLFYTGNTLTDERRRAKEAQFQVVRFFVELARNAEAAAPSKGVWHNKVLSARQATVGNWLWNSKAYTLVLVLAYAAHMGATFWEAAYWGQNGFEVRARAMLIELACFAVYGADTALWLYIGGAENIKKNKYHVRFLGVVAVLALDWLYELFLGSHYRPTRILRPMLVYLRHARVRTQVSMLSNAAASAAQCVSVAAAMILVGSVLAMCLLRADFLPGCFEKAPDGSCKRPFAGPAPVTGSFEDFHTALLSMYGLMATSDNYMFIYIVRAFPEFESSSGLASTLLVFYGTLMVSMLTVAATQMWETYKAETAENDARKRVEQRRYLALAFKHLDDRGKGFVSIERLRYLLSFGYTEVPFEPIAAVLARNVHEQAGLLDFFDFQTVMNMVIKYRPANSLLNTRVWITLPLGVVLSNVAVLALHGVVKPLQLDAVNSFYSFLYAVELGTKVFAMTPSVFWQSSCNRCDLILVSAALCAQVSTIIWIYETRGLLRMVCALPVLRIFVLTEFLRVPLVDMLRSVATNAAAAALLPMFVYSAAIVGMEFLSGTLSAPSGYPGQSLNFNDFPSALLCLLQATIGGWSLLLLDAKDGADAARRGSWFLIIFRTILSGLMAHVVLQASAKTWRLESQSRLEVTADTAGPDDVQDFGAAGDGPSKPTDRQDVAVLMSGVKRLQVELHQMENSQLGAPIHNPQQKYLAN